MKRLFFITLILILCVGILSAQTQIDKDIPYHYAPLKGLSTYTNSSGDTTQVFSVGAATIASLYVLSSDSIAADIYIDKRVRGTTAWTQVYADSIVTLTATGTAVEIQLRDGDTDIIDGVSAQCRARIVCRAAANGVAGTRTLIVQVQTN